MKKVRSVERALQVLNCFSFERPTLSLKEISELSNLHKSTLLRILQTLREKEFVEMDKNRKYRLGLQVYKLGNVFFYNLDIEAKAEPYLKQLANKTNKTVHLGVIERDKALILDKIEPDEQSIRIMMSRKGRNVPLHCTSIGKVLLSFQPDEKRKILLESIELKKYTENTITEKTKLEKELERIHKQGFGFDFEEHEKDIVCVAAPIKDIQSKVVASISISAILFQTPEELLKNELRQKVVNTAEVISRKIGYIRKE
jgi:IclR family KDG regulon transcriptional repressor